MARAVHAPIVSVALLRRTLGVRYSWGAGRPGTPFPGGGPGLGGGVGFDCSGLAQACACALGQLSHRAPDTTADGLRRACLVVPPEAVRASDFAFYGSPQRATHVVVMMGGASRNFPALSANGGRGDNGDNPKAVVKTVTSNYRRDFLGYGRLARSYHPPDLADVLAVYAHAASVLHDVPPKHLAGMLNKRVPDNAARVVAILRHTYGLAV